MSIIMVILYKHLLVGFQIFLYILGGGYFCKFTGDPSKCHMCYSTLHDPQKKKFCKQCIVRVKQNDGLCPECGKDFKSLPCEELNEILQISGKKKYVYLYVWHADGIKEKVPYSQKFSLDKIFTNAVKVAISAMQSSTQEKFSPGENFQLYN